MVNKRLQLLKKIILFSGTLFSISAQASLENDLVALMKSRVFNLDREMVTYRYEDTEVSELQTMRDIESRVEPWAARFYDHNENTKNIAGPGVYVSVDPVSSITYGGLNTPQMYILSLKKGIRLLDLSETESPELKKVLKQIADSFRCQLKDAGSGSMFLDMRISENIKCREVAVSLTKALKVDAIIYPYRGAKMSGCRYRSVALNVISKGAIDYTKSHFFTNDRSIVSDGSADFSKNLFVEVKDDFRYRMTNVGADRYVAPSEFEKLQVTDQTQYNLWKKSNIYACGSPWAHEKGKSSISYHAALSKVVESFYLDSEIQNLTVALKAAVFRNNPDNVSEDIVGIMRLLFAQSGLVQNETSFKKWLFVTTNYDDENYQKKLYKLLRVPEAIMKMAEEEQHVEIERKVDIKSTVTADYFIRLGSRFGTKNLMIYNQNMMSLQAGGIILSVLESKNTMPENIALSKKRHVDVLKKCIAMYSKEKFEYIQSTDCAIVE